MIMTHVIMTCDNAADFERLKAISAAAGGQFRTEPGCLVSCFAADIERPFTLHGVARYRDQAALDAHIKAEHTKRYMDEMRTISRVVMDGQKFEVAAQIPMMAGVAGEAFDKLSSETR